MALPQKQEKEKVKTIGLVLLGLSLLLGGCGPKVGEIDLGGAYEVCMDAGLKVLECKAEIDKIQNAQSVLPTLESLSTQATEATK